MFNRAENLALEAIILATRFKIAKENNNKELYIIYKNRIEEYIEKIKSFGENKKALNAVRVILNFLKTQ